MLGAAHFRVYNMSRWVWEMNDPTIIPVIRPTRTRGGDIRFGSILIYYSSFTVVVYRMQIPDIPYTSSIDHFLMPGCPNTCTIMRPSQSFIFPCLDTLTPCVVMPPSHSVPCLLVVRASSYLRSLQWVASGSSCLCLPSPAACTSSRKMMRSCWLRCRYTGWSRPRGSVLISGWSARNPERTHCARCSRPIAQRRR